MKSRSCISDADLHRLWEGDVTPEEREDFQQHLRTCERCAKRWDQIATDAGHFQAGPQTVGNQHPGKSCPSDETMTDYLSGALEPTERQAVEAHVAQCRRCKDEVRRFRQFSREYEKEGDKWWDEVVGRQVLRFAAEHPKFLDDVLRAARVEPRPIASPGQVVTLPIFQAEPPGAQRLAAATGEEFSRQVLRQEKPPFELDLVQFGRQLRFTARVLEQSSPYNDCLASLVLLERASPAFSKAIFIERGTGRSSLRPEEVEKVRPKRGPLTVRLDPLATIGEAGAAGVNAYTPMFEDLLSEEAPDIRLAAVQVLARLRGPDICPRIKPLMQDTDPSVRSAARKVLKLYRYE